MLENYELIADTQLENALYFFRERIANAFKSGDYAGSFSGERVKSGKNDLSSVLSVGLTISRHL